LSYRWDFIGISQNALKKGKCKVANSSTCKNPPSFPHDTMKALSTDIHIASIKGKIGGTPFRLRTGQCGEMLAETVKFWC
jgi:hypothetical protein